MNNIKSTRFGMMYWILLFVLLVVTRLGALSFKVKPNHDATFSRLQVAGKAIEFFNNAQKNGPLYGRWVQVKQWQDLWSIDRPFCFNQITKGLVETDMHPPLYFWILHVHALIFGNTEVSGVILNIIFDLLSAVLIFKLCNSYVMSVSTSYSAVFLWTCSFAVIFTATLTKQYSFLALLTLIHVYFASLADRQQKVRAFPLLGLFFSALAGMLTYYSFFFIPFVCGIYLFWKYRRDKLVWMIPATYLVAAGAFFLIYPEFLIQYQKIQGRSCGLDSFLTDLSIRGILSFYFLLPTQLDDFLRLNPKLLYLGYGSIVIVLGVLFYVRRQLLSRCRRIYHQIPLPLFVGLFTTICIVGLYFLGLGLRRIGGQYMIMAWPFFSIFLAGIFYKNKERKILVTIYICFSTMMITSLIGYSRLCSLPSSGSIMNNFSRFVITQTHNPGHLGRLIEVIPSQNKVFIASQEHLLATREWQEDLTETLYMSKIAYDCTRKGRKKVFSTIPEEYTISEIQDTFMGLKRTPYNLFQAFKFTSATDKGNERK